MTHEKINSTNTISISVGSHSQIYPMVMDRSSEKDNFHLENHASDSSWSICLSPYCVSLCRPLCQSLCFSLSVPLSLSVCLCACVCLSQNQTKIDNHLGWFWLGWLPRLVGIETTITTSNSGFKLCRDTQWTTQTTSAMSNHSPPRTRK